MNSAEEIYNKIASLTSLNTTTFIIQGGYFENINGIDDFSINTLNMAINLGKLITKASKRKNVFHNILINDLGQTCSSKGCVVDGNIESNGEIKLSSIEKVINNSGLESNLFTFSTEKTLKNRGLRKMRKILKIKAANEELYQSIYFLTQDKIIKCYLSSNYGNDILLLSSINNNYIAKCPLIMGCYYADMFLHGSLSNQKSINCVFVIDFCSFTDKDKVMKGAEVALRLFNETSHHNHHKTIMPIFCDTDCEKMVPLEMFAM